MAEGLGRSFGLKVPRLSSLAVVDEPTNEPANGRRLCHQLLGDGDGEYLCVDADFDLGFQFAEGAPCYVQET